MLFITIDLIITINNNNNGFDALEMQRVPYYGRVFYAKYGLYILT